MIDTFKRKLLDVLKEKEVSLAMIYDREGRILWHSGRRIRGATVDGGEGFSKTSIKRTLSGEVPLSEDDVMATSCGDDLPKSARMLFIKSLLIRPLAGDLFLYVDSGARSAFGEVDRQVLGMLGELLAETIADARTRGGPEGGLSGTSAAMQAVRDAAAKYALEDEPILVTGETGVGKNRAAELIHRVSGRRGPFVVAHLPSIPEGLIESELFGHRKGAFTGALEDRRGLVEEAAGGTLFLDEVAEVPLTFQAKLLRFIETRRYRVVGDPKEREADVRMVAATNRELEGDVRQKRFREDLYFRMSVLCLRIPPLRERKEDLRILVSEHERRLRGKTIGEGFWDVVLRHTWPGNVRELVHVLTRAGVELEGAAIGREIAEVIGCYQTRAAGRSHGVLDRATAALAAGGSFWDTVWQAFLDRDVNRSELHQWLVERHAATGGNLKHLAASLNIEEDYARFISALHKYDIHPGRDPHSPQR